MEFFGEIVSFIVGALGGSLVTYQVTKKSLNGSGKANVVDQSGGTAGRDMIGGNKTKK